MRPAPALLLAAATGLAACAAEPRPAGFDEAHRAALEDSILAVADSYAAAVTGHDPDAWWSRFDSEAGVAENGMVFPSADSVERAGRALFAVFPSTSAAWRERRVSVLGPDVATLVGTLDFLGVDSIGRRARLNIAVTQTLARRSDGWKIVAMHQSFRAPSP